MSEESPPTKLLTLGLGTHMVASKVPVGNIWIEGREYRPQPDITPYEVAMIVRLFVTATASSGKWGSSFDYEAFIVEHKLDRHFPKQGT